MLYVEHTPQPTYSLSCFSLQLPNYFNYIVDEDRILFLFTSPLQSENDKPFPKEDLGGSTILFPSPRPQDTLAESTPITHRHTTVFVMIWFSEPSYLEKRGKGLRTQAFLFWMSRSIQFHASWQKQLFHCQLPASVA